MLQSDKMKHFCDAYFRDYSIWRTLRVCCAEQSHVARHSPFNREMESVRESKKRIDLEYISFDIMTWCVVFALLCRVNGSVQPLPLWAQADCLSNWFLFVIECIHQCKHAGLSFRTETKTKKGKKTKFIYLNAFKVNGMDVSEWGGRVMHAECEGMLA